MWERSFVGVSVLLGASIDDALGQLPDEARTRVAELETRLRDARRPMRAQGLAVAVQEVAMAITEVTLR
ncbi:MAG TPA: hypothetical protein VLT33_33155 [Labilithrix sp.]|nr:hypothetical protein [Labilithrix sp.]